ncbi:hypothetical protein [Azospirillum rugosum]|uniref:Uncharacterized protein n=1 Tax=Azospirillum rugosum TaxID=416170 RepID=A0ABS4STK8_9PROT|nr:hypothetical protein [Azospirillum rugosum]MBP2294715.1 hypothetical protein [Azospirillum rugosum]MDQ0527996.1 hypothetical protein [Azospirillum rugosum]
MPFITTTEAERDASLLPPRLPEHQQEPAPAFLTETVPAAFRQGNTVGAALSREWSLPSEPNPDFDPFAELGDRYRPYARSFIDAEGPADVLRIKRQIDQELDDRRTLAASGTAGLAAGLVAGFVDPVNLLPLGVTANAVRGAAVPARIVTGALGAGAGAAAQEAALQDLQETRSPEESLRNVGTAVAFGGAVGGAMGAGSRAVNAARGAVAGAAVGGASELVINPDATPASVGVSALLSGILGGAVGAVHGSWHDLEAQAARDLTPAGERGQPDIGNPISPGAEPIDPMLPGQIKLTAEDLARDTGGRIDPASAGPRDGVSSVGAAQARASVAEERLVSALGLEKGIAQTAPMLRLATSPSIETRRVAQELIETPYTYEKNALGVASPVAVETRVKMWDAPLASAIEGMEAAFLKYRTGRPDASMKAVKAGDLFGGARRADRLTFDQFKREVGKAMRRGDEHQVPEVAEAARAFRSKLFDPLKERAIETGLLPEDVKPETAVSYLTRVYSHERIKAERPQFVRTVTDWLTGQRDGAADRLEEHRAKVEALTPQAERERAQVAETSAALTKAQTELNRLRADRRAAVNEHRRAINDAKRTSAGTPQFGEFMKDVRRGRPAGKPPLSLSAWLAKKGGVQNQGGELRALGIDHKTRPGLINKNGMPLDEAARAAWEEGYIGARDERPDIQELLDALHSDVSGRGKVYREDDLDYLMQQQEIDRFREDLDREGLDLAKMTDAELEARVALEREGPISEAEARRLEIDAALATDRVKVAEARTAAAGKRLEDIRARVAEARTKRDEMEMWLANRKEALRDTEAGLAKAEAKVKEAVDFARAEDVELEDIAQQITDRILGAPAGRIPYDVVPLARGPLKERTFNIPDELIERWLESDVEAVAKHYRHTMAPDVELARTFGRADLADQIAKVGDDYVQKMRATTDSRQLRRLDAQRRADVRDLEAMRDRVRGTYRAPADPDSIFHRAVPVIANFNYVRLLGQMTVSSIGDLSRPVAVHGITRVFGDGLAPLVRNFAAFRASAEEVKAAGTALDMVLHSRAMSLADIGDEFGRRTRFERGLSATANHFGAIAIMAPWNAALKQFSGVITATNLIRDAQALAAGKLGRDRITRLAAAGIDHELAQRIAQQFAQHGESQDGVHIAHTDRWTDRQALETFRAAIVREVDRTINTPSAGIKPLWMSSPVGKLVGQFKSFSFATTQQIAIAGLQRRDAAILNGLMLAVGLGMVAQLCVDTLAGREPKDDPGYWIVKGLDKSGALGWLFDAANLTGKFTRGLTSPEVLTGGGEVGRYAGQNPLEALLGPTAGLVGDIGAVTGATVTGEWSRGDVSKARRLLPFQNLFFLRWLFDKAEGNAAMELGLPEERAGGRR